MKEEERIIRKVKYSIDIEPTIESYLKKGFSIEEAKEEAISKEKETLLQSFIQLIKAHELIEYAISKDGTYISGELDLCINRNSSFEKMGNILHKYFNNLRYEEGDDNMGVYIKDLSIISNEDKAKLAELGWVISDKWLSKPKRKDTII